MDPLSVAALVLNAIDVSAKVSGKVTRLAISLKNAPADILALANEIEDLRVVLHEAQGAREILEAAKKDNPSFLEALCREIRHAQTQVDILDDVIDVALAANKARRWVWVRQESHIARRKLELRQSRERIQELLATHNV